MPIIQEMSSSAEEFTFILKNVNVSIANAIRRTILSDIQVVVCGDVTVLTNTTRLNNEIIKQRLGCLPVYLSAYNENDLPLYDTDGEYIDREEIEAVHGSRRRSLSDETGDSESSDSAISEELSAAGGGGGFRRPDQRERDDYRAYQFVVDISNAGIHHVQITTDNVDVTLEGEESRNVFIPPDHDDGSRSIIARLRKKMMGVEEKLNLTGRLKIGKAKENGMYNAAHTCTYFNTPNITSSGGVGGGGGRGAGGQSEMYREDIEYFEKQRNFIPNSFTFCISSASVYSNKSLVKIACNIIIEKLSHLKLDYRKNEVTTIANCYDITLFNEDYTIGKIIEYYLYSFYFEKNVYTYCGFIKRHPHDIHSTIRIGCESNLSVQVLEQHIHAAVRNLCAVYENIRKIMNT